MNSLSADQLAAEAIILQRLASKETITMLAGAAGTGKTTLMKSIISKLPEKPVLLAPTGKAAVRLHEVVGRPASTIHSALYPGAIEDEEGKLIWQDPGPVCKPGQVVIVDEASMIGELLAIDLISSLPFGAKILAVGDPFQLPPVNEDPGFELKNAHALLTQVHRQDAINPVLGLATSAREGKWGEWLATYKNSNPLLTKAIGKDYILSYAPEAFAAKLDAVILTYTNEEKDFFNKEIRKALGLTKLIEPGDKIIVRQNNKKIGVMNGETFTVEKLKYYNHVIWGKYCAVKFVERKTTFFIKTSLFTKSRNEFYSWQKTIRALPANFIHADYGYALTIHSSQGSEYQHVYAYWGLPQERLLINDFETCKKMAYTAWTRSYEYLHVVRY